MISHLSASAALFAIVATVGLAAAEAHQRSALGRVAAAPAVVAAEPLVIVLPRVEVIGRRSAATN